MRVSRQLAAALAAAVLLAALILPALAMTQGAESMAGEDGAVPIASWDELRDWSKHAVGTAVLASDVTIPTGESFHFPGVMGEAVLACGEFTLYIEGALFIEGGAGLTISGLGGEEGLLHVREGGTLALSYLTLTASAGAALVQEEGSLVNLDQSGEDGITVSGEVRLAAMPVLTEPHIEMYREAAYVVIPEDDTYERYLPATRQADVYFGGGRVTVGTQDDPGGPYSFQQSVAWDVGESDRESLEARRRTMLRGCFTGPLAAPGLEWAGEGYCALFTPEVLAVFPVDGAALLECSVETKFNILRLSFTFSPAPNVFRLLCSTDEGETWTSVNGENTPYPSDAVHWTIRYPMEDWETEAWYLVEAEYADPEAAEGVRLVHTDVITPVAAEVKSVDWIDGHRGGGEDIMGGEPSPPPTVPATVPPIMPPTDTVEPPEDLTPPAETPPPPADGHVVPEREMVLPKKDKPSARPVTLEPEPSLGEIQARDEIAVPEDIRPSPQPDPESSTEGSREEQTNTAADGEVQQASENPAPQEDAPATSPETVLAVGNTGEGRDTPTTQPVPVPPEAEGTEIGPGMQITLGVVVVVGLVGGAVVALNPGLLKRLFR